MSEFTTHNISDEIAVTLPAVGDFTIGDVPDEIQDMSNCGP
jgi:hypothetical protein